MTKLQLPFDEAAFEQFQEDLQKNTEQQHKQERSQLAATMTRPTLQRSKSVPAKERSMSAPSTLPTHRPPSSRLNRTKSTIPFHVTPDELDKSVHANRATDSRFSQTLFLARNSKLTMVHDHYKQMQQSKLMQTQSSKTSNWDYVASKRPKHLARANSTHESGLPYRNHQIVSLTQ